MGKGKPLCAFRKIRADIRMEMKMMLADLLPTCPVESPDFNAFAMAWIEKNAARFRKRWERCHNRKKECAVGD
jgi:hypothetical protein